MDKIEQLKAHVKQRKDHLIMIFKWVQELWLTALKENNDIAIKICEDDKSKLVTAMHELNEIEKILYSDTKA